MKIAIFSSPKNEKNYKILDLMYLIPMDDVAIATVYPFEELPNLLKKAEQLKTNYPGYDFRVQSIV